MDATIKQLNYHFYLCRNGSRIKRVPCNFLLGTLGKEICRYFWDGDELSTQTFYDSIEIVSSDGKSVVVNFADTNRMTFLH